jgi:hypothetical protein
VNPDELAKKLYSGELSIDDLEVQRVALQMALCMGLEGYLEEIGVPGGGIESVLRMDPKLIAQSIVTWRKISEQERQRITDQMQVILDFGEAKPD